MFGEVKESSCARLFELRLRDRLAYLKRPHNYGTRVFTTVGAVFLQVVRIAQCLSNAACRQFLLALVWLLSWHW